MKTKVIFRIWPKSEGGDVIALFPALAGDVGKPHTCSSYQHLGQHGSADLSGLTSKLRLATPAEYADLKRELENYGPADAHYILDIRKRATHADYLKRVKQLTR